MAEWKPRILVLACHWCTYAGADLAGGLRYFYPSSVHIVRVPCSGRVEPEFILKALKNGADGVFVGGCHFGDCHYKEGNYKAIKRFNLLKRILIEVGLEPERVKLEWISGAEGRRFADAMTEFDSTIQRLGPNPLKGGAHVY